MTEKEKQIEEMAKITCRYKDTCINYKRVCSETKCENLKYAEALYNADYRKQRGWISVDERLPERQGTYLVHTVKGAIKFGEFRSYLVNDEPQFDYFVTHWMPLPEPPQVKGGDA